MCIAEVRLGDTDFDFLMKSVSSFMLINVRQVYFCLSSFKKIGYNNEKLNDV